MKKILIVLLFSFTFLNTNAQEIYDQMADEICSCIQKEETESVFTRLQKCTENTTIKNMSSIFENESIKSFDEIDDELMDEFIQKITGKLTKNCTYLSQIAKSNYKDKSTLREKELNCTNLKTGDYYYVYPSITNNNKVDTVYASFSKNYYIERLNKGKTYNLQNIKWTDDCSFNISMIQSNSPFLNSYSEHDKKYSYKIIDNNQELIKVKLTYDNWNQIIDYIKLKK